MRNHSLYKRPEYDALAMALDYPKWYRDQLRSMKGACLNCGKELPKKSMNYCDSGCRFDARHAIHDMRVTSLRRYIHKKFSFECQVCGKKLCKETEVGVQLPIFIGEVDHIIPLYKGGSDTLENLQLLCVDCHKLKTKSERIKP